MMRSATVAIACVALASAACTRDTFVIHTRASPKRVERKIDQRSENTVFRARRRSVERVDIRVSRRAIVTVARTVVYGASETRGVGGSPLWELLEFPLGVIGCWTFFMDMGVEMFNRRGQRSKWRHKSFFTTFLDPTTRLLSVDFTTYTPADKVEFPDDPQDTHVYTRMPIAGQLVRYRIVDDARGTLRQGQATTDSFGSVAIDGISDAAVAVEVTVGEHTEFVGIPALAPN